MDSSPVPAFVDEETLLPAIAQDATTGEVLMMAYMNRAAWQQTLATREAHYYSRSRRALWRKGETSGHVQRVEGIFVDCDGDAILLRVQQAGGAACHEGFVSCFFRQWVSEQWQETGQRVFDPRVVYPQAP